MDYPHYILETELFDSDLDFMDRPSAAKLCDILQRGATASAAELGVGKADLIATGHSWMLNSLSVVFDRMPRPAEKIRLTTWPSGVKGKLVCYRDYKIEGEGGDSILRGTSEWIYVDIVERRICRLLPRMMTLAPEGVPRVDIPPRGPKPQPEGEPFSSKIPVRRADVDFNHHVNNIHYVEWLFEALPLEAVKRRLARLDITYRAEALYGDTIVSKAWLVEGGAKTLHSLVREADGQLLTSAVCAWA